MIATVAPREARRPRLRSARVGLRATDGSRQPLADEQARSAPPTAAMATAVPYAHLRLASHARQSRNLARAPQFISSPVSDPLGEARVRPIARLAHKAVSDWIVVDVVGRRIELGLVTDQMLPVAPLPDRALAALL